MADFDSLVENESDVCFFDDDFDDDESDVVFVTEMDDDEEVDVVEGVGSAPI